MNSYFNLILVPGAIVIFASGAFGGTINFDGVNDQVIVGAQANLKMSSQMTLEAWINPTRPVSAADTRDVIMGREGEYLLARGGDGTIYYAKATGTSFAWRDTSVVVPSQVWFHLALTFDGTTFRLYTNGVVAFSESAPGAIGDVNTSLNNFQIGGRQAVAQCFQGQIDEVRVWNLSRTAIEISTAKKRRLTGNEPGLVAYYPFDESIGNATRDASLHGLTGTLSGDPVWNPVEDILHAPSALTDSAVTVTTNSASLTAWIGPDGASTTNRFQWGTGSTTLSFDGVNDEIIVPHDAALNSYPLTLTTWVRVEPGGNGGLLNKYAASANGWRILVSSSGSVRAVYFKDANNRLAGNTPGSSEIVTGPIDDGQWHHVAFTVDASGGKVYIDGDMAGSANWIGTPGQATINAPLEIGWAGGTFLKGQMDDVAVWNTSLSSSAISNLIASGQTSGDAQYSNVVAHWEMDEGTGKTAADVSGHDHNGDFSDGPIWRTGARPIISMETSAQVVSGTNAAINLDGVDDFVDVPDGVWFNGDFTIEFDAFVRRYTSYASFLDFGNGAPADNVLVALDQNNRGNLKLWTYLGASTSSLASITPVPLNQWVHLAATLQGSTATLYQDGVIVAKGTVNIPAGVLRTNTFLGRPNGPANTYSDALMDNVRIWNVARTSAQIQAGINQPVDPSDATLLLNYQFDEISGSNAIDSRTIAPQNGTLVNGVERLPMRSVAQPLAGLLPGTRYFYRSTVQSTNGNGEGLVSGFATLRPGSGTALDFDGKNDQITGIVPQLPVGNSPYTIEAWIKPNVMNAGGIVGWGSYGAINQVNVLRLSPTGGGGVRNYWWNNDMELMTGSLTDDWHHVAVSFDGSTRKIYLDGVKRAEAPASGHNVTTTANFSIGKTYNSEYFDGQIDEVRIWNIARTDAEVADYMNERLVGDEPGLVLYNRLDEGSGFTTRDDSPHAADLALMGGPEWAGSDAGVGVPIATTLAASEVGFGAARLNGSVNSEDSTPSRYWFEYGSGGSFNLITPEIPLSSGIPVVSVSGVVTNLGISPSHHFRLVAANDNGTNFGVTQEFTMPVPGARTALEFDGANDYVSLGSSNTLKIIGHEGTWEAWIRPTIYKDMIILNKEGEYEMGLFGNGQLWWALKTATPGWAAQQTGIVPPLNRWTHVAFVYNGTNVVLYTNGVPAKTITASGAIGDIFPDENEFRVGSRQASGGISFWQGGIDDVRVWNVARSPAEIATSFNRSLLTPQPGLLVYLTFNEGSGMTVTNLGTNINGTLKNGPVWIPSGARIIDPVAITLAPSPVLATSATLRGLVNPSGENVNTYFEYGPTISYGNSTTPNSYPGSLSNLQISANLSGLEPGTRYHYRLVAYSAVRTNYGANQVFDTLVLGSGWPVSTKLTGGEASSPLHVLDGLGNTFVAGIFSGSASFKSPMTPTGGATANAFVGKMSRTADWLWSINIPASANGFTSIKAIALDAERNIYVAGQFSGTNSFGGNNLVSNDDTNLFVAKLDASGTNWLWAKAVGGAGLDSANALAVTGTNIFVTGSFSGTANFTVSNLVSAGGSDVFVARLDPNGNWIWATRGGGTSNSFANTLVTDLNQNVIVAGDYSGTVTFGSTTLTNGGGTDLFLSRLSPSGTWLEARRGGSANNDTAAALTRDDADVYLAGQFGGTANYGGTLENVNLGANTNIFVLKLAPDGSYVDYFQGGPGNARSITVDSQNRLYIAGEFSFATSFGTNSLIASGNTDVFIAQLVGGEWTWAQKIGSAGTETGSISTDADDSVVISGTYQGTISVGYVALSTPNNRDIFVARLGADRVYEHNNYIVGQPIPVPVLAQDPAYIDGAIGQPTITILEKGDQPDSDAANSFAWGIAEHKIFPLRQVTAIFKWPLTTNPTNTTAVVTAVGRITYPTNPVVHIANTPAELEPAVSGFPLKFLSLDFTTINGASVDASTKVFTAPAPGWSVLRFLDTGGELPNPAVHPSKFEVVRTFDWNDPLYLKEESAKIGTALTNPNHEDPTLKNGYVYFENALYDGTGTERAYNRASRTGPIIPVNKKESSTVPDLVVVWYHVSDSGIAWPNLPVRYDAQWPTNAAELVLASRIGSGPLPIDFLSKRVYRQADPNLPGFNPNEEHAAIYGDTLYALRNDLNNVMVPKASEPYTLLKYIDPTSGEWAMQVFKVVTTNATFPFIYNGVAGQELVLPEPLNFLALCNLSNRVVSGPGFQDYIGRIYARAAGPGNNGTNIVARYWYPLQPDFDGLTNVSAGTCVPWLDRRPGGVAGTPVDIRYNITWPAGVPKLELGDTWFGARPGVTNVSAGLNSLESLHSANVIYDQGNPSGTNSLGSLARLFDPLTSRTQQLAMNFVLPATISTANDAGLRVFSDLPYSLRARLRYDNLNKRLIFSGLLNESPEYGGPNDPLLLINVLSPRERERIKLLSTDVSFRAAVDDLYDLTRNPNQLDSDSDGQPDKALLIGLTYNSETNGIVPEKLGEGRKALTAGPGTGTGYITVAENNDSTLAGLPVKLHVIQITDGPFRGDIKVLYPDDVFDQKLTLRHSADFGGEPQRFEFEWYYMPDDPALNHNNLPSVDSDGIVTALNGWTNFPGIPPGTNGFNDITIGDGGQAGLLALADHWFICRYRGYAINGETNWTGWIGDSDGAPKFAEGWVKRVLGGLNPFEARTTNFHENATVTFASMLQQAGTRYEGDIVSDSSGANLNSIGLIETYETVLRRARNLSVDAGIDDPAANNTLLLAASRISDLYMLLGNEAYADAADPTIGFRTDNLGYGTLAPSIFTFQNQLDSLLEEELVLLRGRDDRSATVRSAPVYNRLFWNFTQAEGEVAYAQSYNITDQNNDGIIDANDARIMYPQGHGDAWGHYLTATKTYYSLLRSTNFDWEPRSETLQLAGTTVQVDYQDERKFARAAAAKAKVGAEVVDLTYRLNYVDDPAGQYQGYKDTDSERAWGLSEWGHRAGSAALFDWAVANAILPATDPNTNHTGISKIDRTTVPELNEIIAGYDSVQSQVDKADAGLNPLGIAKNSVPFDIDPSLIAAGKTHFEQIYDRALEAVNNTVTVFNHANQLSQALRGLQDTVNQFSQNVDQQERDLKNRLIEVFGYPYAGDIGAGKTFPSGYDGPDIYHYMYVNAVELNGDPVLSSETETNLVGYFTPLGIKVPGPIAQLVDYFFPNDVGSNSVSIATQAVLHVSYPISSASYGLVALPEWGQRRAPGELQQALSDMLQSQARLKQGIANHESLLRQIDDAAELLNARYGLQAEIVTIRKRADNTVTTLSARIAALKLTSAIVKAAVDSVTSTTDIILEGIPKVVGTATDVTAPVRGTLKAAETMGTKIGNAVIAASGVGAEVFKGAQDDARRKETIEIEYAQFEYETQQKLKELEQLIRQEPGLRLEALALREALLQNVGRYQATLAKGLRLMEERIAFRKNSAADTQASRYQDMTFRIFRNDAIQKYRAQFDLAARYVYLAAIAYDYETQLLGGRPGAGRGFLTDIVKQRALGEVINGVPVAGRHGLADPLARLSQNFGVLKGQLGFNNPQTETGRFSLRNEMMRLRDTSDDAWRAELKKSIVANLWDVPEFRRYCRPFAPESAGPQPGLVLRFPTTITFGLNYFGWPLGGGDSAYDPTVFATKVRSAGVWFENYLGSGLSQTPRVYLVPVGADVMRSPSGNNLETREWRVIDQKIPVPFPIGFSSLNNQSWIPMNDSLSDTFADIRRFSSFRAYHDSGVFDPSETITDSRLIGRSVWNTEWMLIIPGGTFLFDSDEGLETFINSVSDIKIFFQTYAYSGN